MKCNRCKRALKVNAWTNSKGVLNYPGSFQYMARTPVSVFAVLMSVTQGMQNAAYIIFFLLIIGGTFAIMDATGAINYIWTASRFSLYLKYARLKTA